MEDGLLFKDMENSLRNFFYTNHLDYVFERNQIEYNNKFKEKSYVSFQQYWNNHDIDLMFKFDLVHYSDGHFHAYISIYQYKDNKLERGFSLSNFLMNKHLRMPNLEEYAGEGIKGKIICYLDNVKEIILPILKGELWLDSPTYWGNYK